MRRPPPSRPWITRIEHAARAMARNCSPQRGVARRDRGRRSASRALAGVAFAETALGLPLRRCARSHGDLLLARTCRRRAGPSFAVIEQPAAARHERQRLAQALRTQLQQRAQGVARAASGVDRLAQCGPGPAAGVVELRPARLPRPSADITSQSRPCGSATVPVRLVEAHARMPCGIDIARRGRAGDAVESSSKLGGASAPLATPVREAPGVRLHLRAQRLQLRAGPAGRTAAARVRAGVRAVAASSSAPRTQASNTACCKLPALQAAGGRQQGSTSSSALAASGRRRPRRWRRKARPDRAGSGAASCSDSDSVGFSAASQCVAAASAPAARRGARAVQPARRTPFAPVAEAARIACASPSPHRTRPARTAAADGARPALRRALRHRRGSAPRHRAVRTPAPRVRARCRRAGPRRGSSGRTRPARRANSCRNR